MVRTVHGRVKLGRPEQTKLGKPEPEQSSRDKTHTGGNEHQSGRWRNRQQRHRHQPPNQQHHQNEAARLSRRQSDQNVRGVDLLEHLVNEEKTDENDYENPFY